MVAKIMLVPGVSARSMGNAGCNFSGPWPWSGTTFLRSI